MKTFCLMILAGLLGASSPAFAISTVKFYRWNPGFRVSSEPAFQMDASEEEISGLLKQPDSILAKAGSELFAGCYVMKKENITNDHRSIASASGQHSGLHKICLSSPKQD